MFVYLKPIVLVFSADEARHKILSMSDVSLELPSILVEENANILEHINVLLSRSLEDSSPQLNKARLADIQVVGNNCFVYHIVFINYETKIKYGNLISIDINNVNLSQSIKSIISFLV